MKAQACTNCGAARMERFTGRTFTVSHGGASTEIRGLAGHQCPVCGDIVFDARSARRYAAAGDALVEAAREATRTEIRRIRRKLGLSQAAAARLTGGGHNAFSRYERGAALPLPAVVNLLKLLDKHPELLKELV